MCVSNQPLPQKTGSHKEVVCATRFNRVGLLLGWPNPDAGLNSHAKEADLQPGDRGRRGDRLRSLAVKLTGGTSDSMRVLYLGNGKSPRFKGQWCATRFV